MARQSRRSSPSSPPSPGTAPNGDGRLSAAETGVGNRAAPVAPLPTDVIAGYEIAILTNLLGDPKTPTSLIGKANAGDGQALDRVIKIFDLRRRYLDRQDVAQQATLDNDDE